MKTVTVRYFASIREALGTGNERLSTAAPDLHALREELIARGGADSSATMVWSSDRRTALPRANASP